MSSSKPGVGRVLGLEAIWLEMQADFDRAAHVSAALKKRIGKACYRQERKVARERLKLLPWWDVLKAVEKGATDGEESEPEEVP